MSSPSFDIYLLTFERDDILRWAVQSVLNQDYPHWTLWIIDGANSTVRFSDPRCRYIQFKESNISQARAHGLTYGDAPYIALIDDDERWEPKHLSAAAHVLTENPKSEILYTDVVYEEGEFTHEGFRCTRTRTDGFLPFICHPKFNSKQLEIQNFLPSGCVLGRRESFYQAASYDPKALFDDWDLWLRLHWRGVSFTHLCQKEHPHSALHYRRWKRNVTNVYAIVKGRIDAYQQAKIDSHYARTCRLCHTTVKSQKGWECPLCCQWFHSRCEQQENHLVSDPVFRRTCLPRSHGNDINRA